MKVCVVGAGAIGGLIGTKLALTKQAEVSALARGATLAALRGHGWRMNTAEGLMQADVRASDDANALGPQDLVVIAVKAQALSAAARDIAPLLQPGTLVLPAMNGLPWWFCQSGMGRGEGPLRSVDPGGVIGDAIPISHVVGCVVHASAATSEPGVVQHRMGQGLVIGEACGGISERATHLAQLLSLAKFDVTHSENIRQDIWYKLWGNMTMNPVSAITGATTEQILGDPLVRAFCSSAMEEASEIGKRLGCPVAQSPEDRHTVTAKLGAFKTSMLQDAEAGRSLEIDAIVGAVRELGARTGVATPFIDSLLGLTRLFAQTHSLYPREAASTNSAESAARS